MYGPRRNETERRELSSNDPALWTHIKCFIAHILDMKEHSVEKGLYLYAKRYIYLVEVVGTVVGIKDSLKRKTYQVDDGTGSVNCVVWAKKNSESGPEADAAKKQTHASHGTEGGDASGDRTEFVYPIKYSRHGSQEPATRIPIELHHLESLFPVRRSQQDIVIGSKVRVRGKLTTYQESREIVIEDIVIIPDPNYETLHMFDSVNGFMKLSNVKAETLINGISLIQDESNEFINEVCLVMEELPDRFKFEELCNHPKLALQAQEEMKKKGARSSHEVFSKTLRVLVESGSLLLVQREHSIYQKITKEFLCAEMKPFIREYHCREHCNGVTLQQIEAHIRTHKKMPHVRTVTIHLAIKLLIEQDFVYEADTHLYKHVL